MPCAGDANSRGEAKRARHGSEQRGQEEASVPCAKDGVSVPWGDGVVWEIREAFVRAKGTEASNVGCTRLALGGMKNRLRFGVPGARTRQTTTFPAFCGTGGG